MQAFNGLLRSQVAGRQNPSKAAASADRRKTPLTLLICYLANLCRLNERATPLAERLAVANSLD